MLGARKRKVSMSAYDQLQKELKAEPKTWLVTGVAGFIGSNLLETLLQLDQRVTGLDNFSTGKQKNLAEVKALVSPAQWGRFRFVEGDIGDLATCQAACAGVDFVLHQAALGSVPFSMTDPLSSHRSNVTGSLNMLVAARDAKARRFVYASSSAIYGDDPGLPKVEEKVGKPLSPYAATKAIDEVYAGTFAVAYGLPSIGLRYFNVFGCRQDPDGAYAAVIPKWTASLLKRESVYINGDGETSRDFCYVANAVQANLLAATSAHPGAAGQVYNVAVGDQTTLNDLFEAIRSLLAPRFPHLADFKPRYRDFRAGDVRHSLADVAKARRLLGYEPSHHFRDGLVETMGWYVANLTGK